MRLSFTCIAAFLLVVLGSGLAFADLSGMAEWRYAEYEKDRDGERVVDASHFLQQYSALWEKEGLINGGRAGQYNLALGAEWNLLDTEINDKDIEFDSIKALYRGDILFAPGGLPFRFNAYSFDMHKTTFQTDNQALLRSSIVRPNIATDLNNGQHLVSGATLLLGIRNGSYLGRYRDVLSQYPRILLDYREIYVRDKESDTPTHYRNRDLAFVSLNKKDNWFHYRYQDYKDYEDQQEDFIEKSYMLGTIDHQMQRRWINMTNWIQISADATYTSTNRLNVSTVPTNNDYSVNLFAKTRRSKWDGATFTSFNRTRNANHLGKILDVPFFLDGVLDRNTSWRFQLIGTRESDEFNSNPEIEMDDLYLVTSVETFRQSRYILAPKLELENKTGDRGEGYAGRAEVEFYSNNAYRPKYDLFGSYSVAYFGGTTVDDEDVDTIEQEIVGRVETDINRLSRVGVEQIVSYATGTLDETVTLHIGPKTLTGLVGTNADPFRSNGEAIRATTTLRGEFRTTYRLDNTVELVYDYVSDDTADEQQLFLRHNLTYNNRGFDAFSLNELITGDVVQSSRTSDDLKGSVSVSNDIDLSFFSRNRASYSPGRSWETNARLDFEWQDGDDGSTTQWLAIQDARYSYFTVNGTVRKLWQIMEEIEYQRFTGINDDVSSLTGFTLRSEYYPTRRTLLGAKLRARYFDYPGGNDTEIYAYLTAQVNFEKLQLAFDYSYGTDDDIDEQRWEVIVKKIF